MKIQIVQRPKSHTCIKRCDWCRKPFDLSDGDKHYYDAQQDCYFCSGRCLYDSFYEQIGDLTIDYILHNPEYNVLEEQKKGEFDHE